MGGRWGGRLYHCHWHFDKCACYPALLGMPIDRHPGLAGCYVIMKVWQGSTRLHIPSPSGSEASAPLPPQCSSMPLTVGWAGTFGWSTRSAWKVSYRMIDRVQPGSGCWKFRAKVQYEYRTNQSPENVYVRKYVLNSSFAAEG